MLMRSSVSLAIALIALPAAAQVASGPEVGSTPPALPAFVVTGDLAEKAVDLAAERKGKPTVFCFVRADAGDRPMARFLKVLDKALTDGVDGAEGAEAVAVWLTDDVGKSKNYLPNAQQSLQFAKTPLAVFEGDRFGPVGWTVNGDARLTTVV